MIFVRYILIQVFAYIIDMGGFLALVYLDFLGPIISNVFGKVAAGIFAFIVHRRFTFRLERKEHNRKQMYRYFFLLSVNVPVSSGVLWVVLVFINNPVVAKLLSDILVVLFSFWLSKIWVFVPDNQVKTKLSHEKISP